MRNYNSHIDQDKIDGLWGECSVNELMRNAAILSHTKETQQQRDRTVDSYASQFTPETIVFNGVTYIVAGK